MKTVDNPATYKEAITKHLVELGSITALDAIKLYGCIDLASYIRLIRREYGYSVIISDPIEFVTRYGRKSQYTVYKYRDYKSGQNQQLSII